MKGQPPKGAMLTNQQLLRLNDEDLAQLGDRLDSRKGVWANEPSHYLAVLIGEIHRLRNLLVVKRSERDEAMRIADDLMRERDDYRTSFQAVDSVLLKFFDRPDEREAEDVAAWIRHERQAWLYAIAVVLDAFNDVCVAPDLRQPLEALRAAVNGALSQEDQTNG